MDEVLNVFKLTFGEDLIEFLEILFDFLRNVGG